jgi:phosphoribosyl-AMP cyclohydrolase
MTDEEIQVRFDDRGLVTTVVQDATTGEVLMVAWANQEALDRTRQVGQAHFWSRSRQELWHKGATSGNFLNVREMWADCDADTLLLRVDPIGPACHTGEQSCFYRRMWAAPDQEGNEQIVSQAADLYRRLLELLAAGGLTLADVEAELARKRE